MVRAPVRPAASKPMARATTQSILAQSLSALFRNNEPGVWFDVGDFERYISPKGPELIANGDFSQGTTGWTTSGSGGRTGTVTNGEYTLTVTATGSAIVIPTAPQLVANVTYEVNVTVTAKTAGTFHARIAANTVDAVLSVGTNRLVLKPTANGAFNIGNAGSLNAGESITFDNVSVRELTAITTASLFQDAAGTTPVTAVEQPVGLMLDKRLGLVRGVDLTPSLGSTTDWTLAPEATITGGQLVVGNTGGVAKGVANGAAPAVAGKTYEILFRVVSVSGSGISVYIGNTATTVRSTPGTYREVAVATNTQPVTVVARGPSGVTSAVIDSISVREIPGNHASQATARALLSARKNFIPTSDVSTAVVGVIGAGGALPAGWGWAAVTGITKEVVAKGVLADGTAYVDLRCYGTHAGGAIAYQDVYFVTSPTAMPTAVGAIVTASVGVQSIAGNSSAGFSGPIRQVQVAEFNVNTYALGTGSALSATSELQTLTATRTFSSATATNARIFVNCSIAPGGTIDWTFRITQPQLEYGSTATRYQRTTATEYDWVGFPLYLKFDGVDDFMSFTVPFLPTDDSLTSYVAAWGGKAGDNPVVSLRNSGGAAMCRYGSANNVVDTFLRDDASVQSRVLNLQVVLGVPYQASHTRAGTTTAQFRDGVEGQTNVQALGVSTISTARLGSDAGGALYSDIRLYSLVMRKGTPSAALRKNVEAALASKVGVPLQ